MRDVVIDVFVQGIGEDYREVLLIVRRGSLSEYERSWLFATLGKRLPRNWYASDYTGYGYVAAEYVGEVKGKAEGVSLAWKILNLLHKKGYLMR